LAPSVLLADLAPQADFQFGLPERGGSFLDGGMQVVGELDLARGMGRRLDGLRRTVILKGRLGVGTGGQVNRRELGRKIIYVRCVRGGVRPTDRQA
jgi:hypothetical protein